MLTSSHLFWRRKVRHDPSGSSESRKLRTYHEEQVGILGLRIPVFSTSEDWSVGILTCIFAVTEVSSYPIKFSASTTVTMASR